MGWRQYNVYYCDHPTCSSVSIAPNLDFDGDQRWHEHWFMLRPVDHAEHVLCACSEECRDAMVFITDGWCTYEEYWSAHTVGKRRDVRWQDAFSRKPKRHPPIFTRQRRWKPAKEKVDVE